MAHVSVSDEVIALADLLRPWRGRFSARRSEVILRLIPSMLYLAGVYAVSDIPGSNLPAVVDDRVGHFLEYFVLSWLLMLTGVPSVPLASAARTPIRSPSTLLALWLFGALFAVSDEFHQSFVPGREVSLRDLLFDFLGLTMGLVLLLFLLRRTEPAR